MNRSICSLVIGGNMNTLDRLKAYAYDPKHSESSRKRAKVHLYISSHYSGSIDNSTFNEVVGAIEHKENFNIYCEPISHGVRLETNKIER